MSPKGTFVSSLRAIRLARGWSQLDLAGRSGVSRAEVSAIETGRGVPSTAVALALARALGTSVEALFRLASAEPPGEAWAWEPAAPGARYWTAERDGRRLRYPVEIGAGWGGPHDGVDAAGWGYPHDGVDTAANRDGAARDDAAAARDGDAARDRASRARDVRSFDPERTLVIAGCDPAVGLLADALRAVGVRLLAFARSSRLALELLAEGRVHVAGVHLGESLEENARAARRARGPELCVLHVARWSEGLVLSPGLGVATPSAAVRAGLRWVGREPGSGARACLDLLLEGRDPPEGYDRLASHHAGVVETIRTGWAQAGVTVELPAREGGLDFLPVRTAAYDLCFPAALEDDARVQALVSAVRSPRYRRLLAELPGYDPRNAGQLA